MLLPKKSLGQNWLKNPVIVDEIVKAGEVKEGDTVLEIGPGQGVLTAKLLATGAKVVAVEKDDRLIEVLTEKFAEYTKNGKFELIHEDILNFFPESCKLKPESYKLVANIPYYLTGQIFRQFLESNCQPSKIVVLVQKEVAERIVAKDDKESLLSMSVKAYGKPKYVRTVARSNFLPIPNVDSAILLIDSISKDFFKHGKLSENRFFTILKKGFGQKRKMLKKNLGLDENILMNNGISPKARAEELTLEQWGRIIKQLKIDN